MNSASISHTISPEVTAEEKELLHTIKEAGHYSVCRFEFRSHDKNELSFPKLDAIHLDQWDDEVEKVEKTAKLLKELEQKGLIILFYDLKAFVKKDYVIYHKSTFYHQMQDVLAETNKEEETPFDHVFVKNGVAVLTTRGKYALRK